MTLHDMQQRKTSSYIYITIVSQSRTLKLYNLISFKPSQMELLVKNYGAHYCHNYEQQWIKHRHKQHPFSLNAPCHYIESHSGGHNFLHKLNKNSILHLYYYKLH